MLGFTPSRVAAAAVNIALRTLKGPAAWDRKLEHYSGFTQEALRPCIKDVEELMAVQPNTLKAVAKKYAVSAGEASSRGRPFFCVCFAGCAPPCTPPPLTPLIHPRPLLFFRAPQLPKFGEVSGIALIPLA